MIQPFDVTPTILREGYDRETFWSHGRPGVTPSGRAVISLQKARMGGCDVFYGLHDMQSTDGGETWSDPRERPELGRRIVDDATVDCPCDGTPGWHAASGKLLLVGHTARYDRRRDALVASPRPRWTYWSVYDEAGDSWTPWQKLELPDKQLFCSAGAGSTQWLELPDGDILLPVYFQTRDDHDTGARCYHATVLRCGFDGGELTYRDHGDILRQPVPRGFCEPSLTTVNGRFFLTLRNDQRGYVTASDDGLHFAEPQPWCFDDGQELGNYNTQQHWVTHDGGLFLVYTRRGADNDHVFRHRAPLFMAQVDPDRWCVLRRTERVVVPERGARLGNFGTTTFDRDEAWVTVAEWMQNATANPYDGKVCEAYGANNAIWLSRIRW